MQCKRINRGWHPTTASGECKAFCGSISGAAQEKGNRLEIDVVNTWVNRILGDEQQPPDVDWVKWDHPQWRGGYTTSTTAMALKDLPDWLVQGKPRPAKNRFTFVSWQYYPKGSAVKSILVKLGAMKNPVSIRRVAVVCVALP